jgi:hypothetical protein
MTFQDREGNLVGIGSYLTSVKMDNREPYVMVSDIKDGIVYCHHIHGDHRDFKIRVDQFATSTCWVVTHPPRTH